MKTMEKKNGSAWAVIFKIGGFVILVFLFPYLAVKNSDSIDRFGDSVQGQLVIFWTVIAVIGSHGITWFYQWIKKRISA